MIGLSATLDYFIENLEIENIKKMLEMLSKHITGKGVGVKDEE